MTCRGVLDRYLVCIGIGALANLTPEQVTKKIQKYAKRFPEETGKVIKKETSDMLRDMRRRYRSSLGERTGKLYRSIKRITHKISGTKVVSAVGVGLHRSKSQVYKAITHEEGRTLHMPGGQPYIWFNGRRIYIRKDKFPDWPLKTGPYTVQIPKRPFVAPVRRAKAKLVKDKILKELILTYEKM